MAKTAKSKRSNPWLAHVKKTMKQMKSKGTYAKGKGLGQVIKEAKKTWHKGGAETPSAPVSPSKPATTGTPSSTVDSTTPTTPPKAPSMGGKRGKTQRRHSRKH